jgi:hypothetical protein
MPDAGHWMKKKFELACLPAGRFEEEGFEQLQTTSNKPNILYNIFYEPD